jgi:hypothetical protein
VIFQDVKSKGFFLVFMFINYSGMFPSVFKENKLFRSQIRFRKNFVSSSKNNSKIK